MKVPASIRRKYEDQIDDCRRLQLQVDNAVLSRKMPRWHYESRIKELESFALKVETGRFENLDNLEDVFACTIVVENGAAIRQAEEVVESLTTLQYRRPPVGSETRKRPDSFPFDDVRLYVNWKDNDLLPPSGLGHIVFEVQIKTFLQHAWAIATHDLIYKADEVSWPLERLAFQIKAMLEHAEVSITEASDLTKSPSIALSDKRTNQLSDVIRLLKKKWPAESLPRNLVRLAENVFRLTDGVGVSISKLEEYLDKDTKSGRGVKLVNLSPFSIVVETLFRNAKPKVTKWLNARSRGNQKLVVVSEVDGFEAIKTGGFQKVTLVE